MESPDLVFTIEFLGDGRFVLAATVNGDYTPEQKNPIVKRLTKAEALALCDFIRKEWPDLHRFGMGERHVDKVDA